MDIETKIYEKVLTSYTYRQEFESPVQSKAAITRHCFDDMNVTQAHNGQASFRVFFRGAEIGSISREKFNEAISKRKERIAYAFLKS